MWVGASQREGVRMAAEVEWNRFAVTRKTTLAEGMAFVITAALLHAMTATDPVGLPWLPNRQ